MLKQSIPVLHIANADAAEMFYCGQLGFRIEFQVPASETQQIRKALNEFASANS
jgi:hypothetical protein